MISKFNAPPKTLLTELPVEFVPLADQSPEITDRPPQVINEDFLTVVVLMSTTRWSKSTILLGS